MVTLKYTAGSIWGANNPVIDDHVIHAVALGMIGLAGTSRTWGLGNRWRSLDVVQNHAFLR